MLSTNYYGKGLSCLPNTTWVSLCILHDVVCRLKNIQTLPVLNFIFSVQTKVTLYFTMVTQNNNCILKTNVTSILKFKHKI